MRLKILLVLTTLASLDLGAQSGMELYQKAVTQERAGKMEDAIKLYEKVAHDFAAERPLAAKALFQAASGYEKLGQDKASKLYEQLTREYGDQREAVTARAKLVALRQPPPTTMALRQITPLGLPVTEAPPFNSFLTFESDGQHALYLDKSAGGLALSDLSGKNKRVIFKNQPNGSIFAFKPSRDYSMIELALYDAAGEQTHAVIKSDGTGYRELSKGIRGLCTPDFSWDNRYLLPARRRDALDTDFRGGWQDPGSSSGTRYRRSKIFSRWESCRLCVIDAADLRDAEPGGRAAISLRQCRTPGLDS
jgi:hypothetical protein